MNYPTTLRRLPALLAVYALVTAATGPAFAQITLLSNLDAPAPVPGPGTGIDATSSKSVAFTTGSTPYSLFSAQAWLTLQSNVPGAGVVAFNLYTPSTPGGNDPGTLAVSLGTQNVNNIVAAPTVYTFTPSSAFVLAADTRYVLQMSWVSGRNIQWFANSPHVTPTARNGSEYSSVVYRINDNGMIFTSSGFNLFAINGPAPAAIDGPEPGTLALLALGTLAGGIVMRRRKA